MVKGGLEHSEEKREEVGKGTTDAGVKVWGGWKRERRSGERVEFANYARSL